MRKFGPLGFFLNQVPHMHLPFPIGLIIKPMILAIELLGLCIKHMVLAIRLLANMVAGHLVLLGIMGLAFGASAAVQFRHAAQLAVVADRGDLGDRLDAVQLPGAVRRVPSGVRVYVLVRLVHRCRNSSSLMSGGGAVQIRARFFHKGDRIP